MHSIRERLITQNYRHYHGVLYDLGCGEATSKEYFLQYATEYVGVDWANSTHSLNADLAADLNQPLPIASGVADSVVALSVLEHLARPEVMLEEAARILVPGGSLVLVVPFQWQMHEGPYDYRRFTSYGLQLLLAEAGFVDVTVEPYAGVFTTLVLKMNYFTRRFIVGPPAVRWLLRLFMIPAWFAGQTLAPYLDKLDRNWSKETPAFCATARKPQGFMGFGSSAHPRDDHRSSQV